MDLLGGSFKKSCAALAIAFFLLSSVALAVTIRPSFAATSSPSAGVLAPPDAQAATSASPAAVASSSSIWHPAVVTSWNWQLSTTPIDLSYNVQMYDIDMFDNSAAQVTAIHAVGAK